MKTQPFNFNLMFKWNMLTVHIKSSKAPPSISTHYTTRVQRSSAVRTNWSFVYTTCGQQHRKCEPAIGQVHPSAFCELHPSLSLSHTHTHTNHPESYTCWNEFYFLHWPILSHPKTWPFPPESPSIQLHNYKPLVILKSRAVLTKGWRAQIFGNNVNKSKFYSGRN